MRTIGVVTVGRSDYGLYRPILRAIRAAPDLRLHLLVAGAHLSPEFGHTVREVEDDGFAVDDRVEMLLSSDSPLGVAQSIGLGVIGFASAFARHPPDLLLVLGDRFEMYAAALAALPLTLPIAHVHGGEVSFGAIDDALRHSMTKLAHLHFVSTEAYARRVVQLGEEPWRVVVSGAPGLDNLGQVPLLGPEELEQRFGVRMQPAPLLVTFHPVTLEPDQVVAQTEELLAALDECGEPVVFTQPNPDAGGRGIARRIDAFVASRPRSWRLDSLGTQGYFSLMKAAAAMVGNSSSGIIEAPSFGLPVVNVGSRQAGRVRAANVIDVPPEREAVQAAIRRALSPAFAAEARAVRNPYGDGHAAERIVARLREVPLDGRLRRKTFHDQEAR